MIARIADELAARRARFDESRYILRVREALEYPSREIAKLGEELQRSRSVERTGRKEEMPLFPTDDSAAGVLITVAELGLRGSTEGLLAKPAGDACELNIDRLKEAWNIGGEWFPFEVYADPFVFVIDDDATIFVSTLNYPEQLIRDARETLQRIAELAYS